MKPQQQAAQEIAADQSEEGNIDALAQTHDKDMYGISGCSCSFIVLIMRQQDG